MLLSDQNAKMITQADAGKIYRRKRCVVVGRRVRRLLPQKE